jgi:hypothetical protein
MPLVSGNDILSEVNSCTGKSSSYFACWRAPGHGRRRGHGPTQADGFGIMQNYPNPFNPSTLIRYDLPFSSNVRLAVYDITGREVKVLVSGEKPAGSYEARLNSRNLESGVYMYRLTAVEKDGIRRIQQTRKLVLAR